MQINKHEAELYSLFPIPVLRTHLGRGLDDSERAAIEENLKSLDTNTYNNYSKNGYVLNHPQLTKIKTFIENSISAFTHQIWKIKPDVDIRITQSWININKRGESHHHHRHPNSLLSGVFYVDADDNDTIWFQSFSPNLTIQLENEENNNYNSDTYWIKSTPNSLILFPSTLVHFVPKTKSERRVSLSFNTWMFSSFGNDSVKARVEL